MDKEKMQKKLIKDFKTAMNLATVGTLRIYEFYHPTDVDGYEELCKKMKKTYKKFLRDY